MLWLFLRITGSVFRHNWGQSYCKIWGLWIVISSWISAKLRTWLIILCRNSLFSSWICSEFVLDTYLARNSFQGVEIEGRVKRISSLKIWIVDRVVKELLKIIAWSAQSSLHGRAIDVEWDFVILKIFIVFEQNWGLLWFARLLDELFFEFCLFEFISNSLFV